MTTGPSRTAGRLSAVSGTVVRAETNLALTLGEVVFVGELGLFAEVIALNGSLATLQVYEETEGLAPGDPIVSSGRPITAELGPGLLGGVFDGLQRPLEQLADAHGDFLGRGLKRSALNRDRVWDFRPSVRAGDRVSGGEVLGTVRETPALDHRVLVPPGVAGRVVEVVAAGPRTVSETVVRLEEDGGERRDLAMFHEWSVRAPRTSRRRLAPGAPLVTGQRVLDTFFPVALGGAAGMPGGFGTGKTVLQNQLCRWASADVIVFVGCGERGNEMTRLLRELPALADPRTGHTLAERTVLIANTSNMPVSAREASLYTGITIAEYYRDMGYHVALLADSTSRWAEALRETAGRLGELPAEEGYPPYLASRLGAFYGRAGRVETAGGAEGSVTIISAVSPPAGDLTEPVTRHTENFTRCFWALDKTLAEARMFPAVNIRDSYSEVPDGTFAWWAKEVSPEWRSLRQEARALLAESDEVEATARLVGAEDLPPRPRLLLRLRSVLEEAFLFQSAFDAADAYCSPMRQFRLLRVLMRFVVESLAAVGRGVSDRRLAELPVLAEIARARVEIDDAHLARFDELEKRLIDQIAGIEAPAIGSPTP
jgi:V/A-type H+-transporting ATPase subunit A